MNRESIRRKLVRCLFEDDINIGEAIVRVFVLDKDKKHPAGWEGLDYDSVQRALHDEVDEQRIKRVFEELYSNGIIHSKDEGKKVTNRHYFLDNSLMN